MNDALRLLGRWLSIVESGTAEAMGMALRISRPGMPSVLSELREAAEMIGRKTP
jgi:hypothetical protein